MRTVTNDTGLLLLGCLLYTAGSAIQYVSPAFYADLGHRLAIDEAQMGTIAAAENIGIGLASALALWWNGRIDRRRVAFFAVLSCVAGDLISFFCRNFHLLLLLRGATATLGEGTLFAMSFLVLAQTRNPDRTLGFALSSVVVFTSAVLSAANVIDRTPVGSGWLLPMAAIALAVLPALRWMPDAGVSRILQPTATDTTSKSKYAFIALLGLTIWSGAPGGFWTFAADAAAARHFPGPDIGRALAIGNVVGLLGSVFAAWQGNRWNRTRPILIGTIGLCLSVAAAQSTTNIAILTAMLAVFNIFWNYTIVYQMALVVALDRTGRAAGGISGAQMVGFAAGGFVSGFAIVGAGFSILPVVASAFAAAGLVLFAVCRRPGRSVILKIA